MESVPRRNAYPDVCNLLLKGETERAEGHITSRFFSFLFSIVEAHPTRKTSTLIFPKCHIPTIFHFPTKSLSVVSQCPRGEAVLDAGWNVSSDAVQLA
jgi:hypothetical protein